MNNELFNKMVTFKNELYDLDQKLRKEHASATSEEEREYIKEQVEECDKKFFEVREDIINYKKRAESNNVTESYEEMLANKYGFRLVKNSEPVEVVNVKKSNRKTTRTIAAVLAGLALLGGGYVLGQKTECPLKYLKERKQAEEVIDNPINENAENVVVVRPFETYGNFTDVNNETQLRERATWYYNTYIADPNKSNVGANFFTIEQIMNDMRNINGEFMMNGNQPTYNDTDTIAMVNDLHTIANYDSLKEYGTQIYFTPMAPLFEDGSLAQKGAIDLDNAMVKVVNAIRANDDEAFLAAAREWGILVVNMFDYIDFTGDYVSIYQVPAPTSFALFHAMNSKYASTILEYSEGHHLNVCIPYCTDYETGELHEEALSQIMYNLNERAIDAVAVRSGNLAEYEANNLSLPENLYVLAKNYFNSKYNLEMGSSRTLK